MKKERRWIAAAAAALRRGGGGGAKVISVFGKLSLRRAKSEARRGGGRRKLGEPRQLKMAWTDKKQVSNLLWPCSQPTAARYTYREALPPVVPLSLLYGSKLWQRGKGKIFCALCVLSECGVSPSIYLHRPVGKRMARDAHTYSIFGENMQK